MTPLLTRSLLCIRILDVCRLLARQHIKVLLDCLLAHVISSENVPLPLENLGYTRAASSHPVLSTHNTQHPSNTPIVYLCRTSCRLHHETLDASCKSPTRADPKPSNRSWHCLREYKTFASHAISLLSLSSCGDAIRILFPKVAWTSYLFGVQVSIAITEQKLLHIDLSANSDSAIIGGPVGALALEHKTFSPSQRLRFRGVSRPAFGKCSVGPCCLIRKYCRRSYIACLKKTIQYTFLVRRKVSASLETPSVNFSRETSTTFPQQRWAASRLSHWSQVGKTHSSPYCTASPTAMMLSRWPTCTQPVRRRGHRSRTPTVSCIRQSATQLFLSMKKP